MDDPTRRTSLAYERTQLAWWRTGLTALAVSLGVGRILPELDHHAAQWPYVVLGVGFAVYGIALIVYGGVLGSEPRASALGRKQLAAPALFALTGALLGLGTSLLIILS